MEKVEGLGGYVLRASVEDSAEMIRGGGRYCTGEKDHECLPAEWQVYAAHACALLTMVRRHFSQNANHTNERTGAHMKPHNQTCKFNLCITRNDHLHAVVRLV